MAGQAGRGCSGSVWVKSRVRSQGCSRQNSRFRDSGKGCGRGDDWLLINGGAVEGMGDSMAEKGACVMHAAC